mmetsp:Transcript_34266/g.79049  ORF Transcript_34266/g.79049 Transcript_34266/m.79049 type:complete len:239 (-) Transcript_34266:1234-1950(-)
MNRGIWNSEFFGVERRINGRHHQPPSILFLAEPHNSQSRDNTPRQPTMMSPVSRSLLVFILVFGHVSPRKERDTPHPHRGVLRPYVPGPFNLMLDGKDEDQLRTGKPVTKSTKPEDGDEETGGGAICVQDINAPKAAVWSQILRMGEYPKKVPKVTECRNYCVRRNRNGSVTMKTFQRIRIFPGYSYVNYYDHTFDPEKDSLVWSLDYDKTSDFDDCSGHWHLQDHPTRPVSTSSCVL